MEPENSTDEENKQVHRDAAAEVVRGQLDAIYNNQPKVTRPSSSDGTGQSQSQSQPQPQAHRTRAGSWQQYHSQWQDYYQKYYERYYVGHLHQAIAEQAEVQKSPEEKHEEDLLNLRQKIVDGAKQSAKKARKSRHFIPAASAVIVMLLVAFVQYNQILIGNVEAYVSPGAIDPQNIVVDPTSSQVSADPRLIIPKINVDVPVIYNVNNDHDSMMAAMFKGVAHFSIPGADSVPGQNGNTVFSGHSSNDVFDPGDYKWIFVQLDKLQPGDTIIANYNSVRYVYTVTKKQVVKPTDVQALLGYNDKPYVTLITCTPIGTALNRLLVTAEQISPDPSKAKAADTTQTSNNTSMPGNGPTLLEKLFGSH